MALARALATRGTELELATKLARRALLLGDDAALREELAGWFATMGESALAAATLQPMAAGLRGNERGMLLVRQAVLLARAGEARAALEALEESMAAHPEDPVGPELLASLAAWSPETVSREQAAEAFVFASERREALGDRAASFENLIRAFESAPGYAAALEKLLVALSERGRHGAADEALREHGKALGPAGRSVHLKRLRTALKQGDVAGALGAAFDARLDGDPDIRGVLAAIDPLEGSDNSELGGLDGLLERAGLHDLLAARAEVACDFLAGRERGRARVALGKLYATKLARPDRALDAWIDAVVSDPRTKRRRTACAAAALRRAITLRSSRPCSGSSRENARRAPGPTPNASRWTPPASSPSSRRRASGLPGLALWARRRAGLDASELASAVEEEEQELAQLRAELATASSDRRLEVLSRLSAPLGAPGQLVRVRRGARGRCAARCRKIARRSSRSSALLVREGKLETLEAFSRASWRAPPALSIAVALAGTWRH